MGNADLITQESGQRTGHICQLVSGEATVEGALLQHHAATLIQMLAQQPAHPSFAGRSATCKSATSPSMYHIS